MMDLRFCPLSPWTEQVRAGVLSVAGDMAALDHEEIYGLRPLGPGAEGVTASIGAAIGAGMLLDGFVAQIEKRGGENFVPVAVALAFRSNIPGVAEVAMFGREGFARQMPHVYRELARRAATFGADHGVQIAQVPVLSRHRAARRMIRSLGGLEVFDYGPIGRGGLKYTHVIWRL
jgi:hypothetical protein